MMRRVPMIWTVLALFGCAVGPVYALPDMALPDCCARLEPVSWASAADMQWWQHFNDPLLMQLVDRAVAGNVGLAETRARLDEVGVAYVDLNRQALDLSRQLFANRGTITVLDVLDRERALSQTRAGFVRSQHDQAIDYIVLHTVIGQGHPLDAQ